MLEAAARIWFIVPCMGRASFLRQTTASALADPRARYCLVDYSCPDRCGDWLREVFAPQVESGQAVVERVVGKRLFNKSAAHNQGAARALAGGAEYLCLLDADTLLAPGFVEWLLGQVRPDRFLIAARRSDGTDVPSLTGLLVVHGDAFRRSGGLDTGLRGWGGEDIEFRIRLRLLHGLEHGDVPLSLLQALPHGDELRTRFYMQKDCGASNRGNLRRIRRRIWGAWRESWKVDPESLERLWYRGVPPGSP